jgi:tryptophan 2,3-dioxygenase
MMSVPFDPDMSSDTERAHHAAQTEGNPVLAFSGPSTPYIDYQSIDVLLSL